MEASSNWWDELPTLVDRHGRAGAIAIAHAIEEAVDAVGTWCEANGADAWYTKAGALSISAAPAQDRTWEAAIELCRELGFGEKYPALTPAQVAARVRSPIFRGGVFMPGAATVQPAILARALRRALLVRGVTIHEGTTVTEVDGERPGWLGSGDGSHPHSPMTLGWFRARAAGFGGFFRHPATVRSKKTGVGRLTLPAATFRRSPPVVDEGCISGTAIPGTGWHRRYSE